MAMRCTGMVRRFDDLGRVVVPKEIRNIFGWDSGVAVEMFTEGENFIMRTYKPGCTFCNNVSNLERYKGLLLCSECITEIKNKF